MFWFQEEKHSAPTHVPTLESYRFSALHSQKVTIQGVLPKMKNQGKTIGGKTIKASFAY
jgi:hypothetical protein